MTASSDMTLHKTFSFMPPMYVPVVVVLVVVFSSSNNNNSMATHLLFWCFEPVKVKPT